MAQQTGGSTAGAFFDVDWSNLQKFNDEMRELGYNASRNLYPAINRALKPYRKSIKDEAPKWMGNPASKSSGRPGDLRRSIKWRVSQYGVSVSAKHPQGAHAWLVYNAISGWPNLPKPYGPRNPFLHRGVGRYRKELYKAIGDQIEEWYSAGERVSRGKSVAGLKRRKGF